MFRCLQKYKIKRNSKERETQNILIEIFQQLIDYLKREIRGKR